MSEAERTESFARRVADTLIEQLHQGTAPWQRPWSPGELRMPHNAATDSPYRGFNAVWLLMQGREESRWMTYRQASDAGAQVRKGERGTQIQYFVFEGQEIARDEHGKPLLDENGQTKKENVRYERPRVVTHTVFNAEQIDGLPPREPTTVTNAQERHARCDTIIANSGVSLTHSAEGGAFYVMPSDRMQLPNRERFTSADAYYATATHELAHATGHPARLDRDLNHAFGSEGYAREELRAEIASLMLGERLEIGHDPGQHAAYVANWMQILTDAPTEIFRAAQQAEQICATVMELEHSRWPSVHEHATARSTEETSKSYNLPDAEIPMPERIYLTVPYGANDQVKALGGRWDKDAKRWWVPDTVESEKIAQWLKPAAVALDPQAEFAAALSDAGLVIDGEPVMDGTLQRVPVKDDKRSQTSGAYVGHLDGHPAGFIQNFRSGYRENWKSSNVASALSAEDRARLMQENAERAATRAADRALAHEQVSKRLEDAFDRELFAYADEQHPYLRFKCLAGAPALLRQDALGNLLVPAYDHDGKLWTVQRISPDGRKQFEKDGLLEGHHYVVVRPGAEMISGPQPIVISEGWATSESIGRATGYTTVTAFSATNLPKVAAAFREKYPDQPIVIAGDNDHVRASEIDPRTGKPKVNIGAVVAQETAKAIGGYAALPAFDAGDKGTDWNDWQQQHGGDALRKEMAVAAIQASQQLLADREAMHEEPESIAMRIQNMVNDVQSLILGETLEQEGPSALDLETALERGQRNERTAEHVAINAPLGSAEERQAEQDGGLELGR